MENQVAVVMVPLPSQSHLNQLLHLSALISSYGLPVHYVGSATHNRQVKLRCHGLDPESMAKIQFHDLHTDPISAPQPNGHISATYAYLRLSHPIASLVRELLINTRKVVIIYDRLVGEAVKEAVKIPNVESYAFCCISAFNLFLIMWESLGKPFELDEQLKKLPAVEELSSKGAFFKRLSKRKPHEITRSERDGDIYNTSRLIEDRFIDLLAREEIEIGGGKKQWAIRPTFLRAKMAAGEKRHKCLEWLDKQAPRSVIYVSFGSVVSLSDEEVSGLAFGLEQSGKRFIWVLKDADKPDIFEAESRRIELPEGFEERVGEDGIVVREWAPQMEILSHGSTGGFMSHCGWNSCFESLVAGVPIAAVPMHSDQPLNATFLAEILGAGVVAREWGEGVGAAAVRKGVERLMSEEGDGVRRRAAEIGAALRKSMEEGGEFWREMDSFVDYIKR